MNFMWKYINLKMKKLSGKRMSSGEVKEFPVVVDVAVSSEDSEILTSFEAKSSGDITKSNIALAVDYKFGVSLQKLWALMILYKQIH